MVVLWGYYEHTVQRSAARKRQPNKIQELINSTGMTAQLMIVAIDRMFQKERQFSMKRTTNPQEAAQAMQEDKIVKIPLGGRNWHVNGISEGANGCWVAKISHPDYENSRIEDVAETRFPWALVRTVPWRWEKASCKPCHLNGRHRR